MRKFHFKKVISVSLIALFSVQALYLFIFEPSVLIAATDDDEVIVTLNVDSGLILSDGANVTMSPNLGISADSSIGASSWIAKTNSSTGYTLAVKASSSPALKNGVISSFADYTEGTPGTPETWSVESGTYQFGYSAYGDDTIDATWGTATGCGSGGIPDANGKYLGFTTSDKTIANRSTVTPTSGIQTNICFSAEQNDIYAPSGTYTATITATMTAS